MFKAEGTQNLVCMGSGSQRVNKFLPAFDTIDRSILLLTQDERCFILDWHFLYGCLLDQILFTKQWCVDQCVDLSIERRGVRFSQLSRKRFEIRILSLYNSNSAWPSRISWYHSRGDQVDSGVEEVVYIFLYPCLWIGMGIMGHRRVEEAETHLPEFFGKELPAKDVMHPDPFFCSRCGSKIQNGRQAAMNFRKVKFHTRQLLFVVVRPSPVRRKNILRRKWVPGELLILKIWDFLIAMHNADFPP